jgi:hypothetical protein
MILYTDKEEQAGGVYNIREVNTDEFTTLINNIFSLG